MVAVHAVHDQMKLSRLEGEIKDLRLALAAERERLRAFAQYVADYSNDPQVVKQALAVEGK